MPRGRQRPGIPVAFRPRGFPAYVGGEESYRGAGFKKNRLLALARDGYRCTACGRTPESGATLSVDHIIPWAIGGSNDLSNLRTLCEICHHPGVVDVAESGTAKLIARRRPEAPAPG